MNFSSVNPPCPQNQDPDPRLNLVHVFQVLISVVIRNPVVDYDDDVDGEVEGRKRKRKLAEKIQLLIDNIPALIILCEVLLSHPSAVLTGASVRAL